jgi:hypothetical protein
VVYYNGALVRCESTQVERHTPIPTEISRRVAGFIRDREPEATIVYEVYDAWYALDSIPDATCTVLGIGPHDPKPKIIAGLDAAALSPTKILVPGFGGGRDLQEEFRSAVTVVKTDGGALVQIMQAAVSKESAVQWVLDNMEVLAQETMVFGDDVNDSGLFRLCGFPVAMKNAIAELKDAAAFVTASNDEDGVALAIEKFLLTSPVRGARTSYLM